MRLCSTYVALEDAELEDDVQTKRHRDATSISTHNTEHNVSFIMNTNCEQPCHDCALTGGMLAGSKRGANTAVDSGSHRALPSWNTHGMEENKIRASQSKKQSAHDKAIVKTQNTVPRINRRPWSKIRLAELAAPTANDSAYVTGAPSTASDAQRGSGHVARSKTTCQSICYKE